MYGASKRFIYTSFEHGNAMGDSIGHFDRIILKGTFERVKFNRYNFLCEEVPCSPLLCPYSLLCDNKNNKAQGSRRRYVSCCSQPKSVNKACFLAWLADHFAPDSETIDKCYLQWSGYSVDRERCLLGRHDTRLSFPLPGQSIDYGE